MRSREEFMTGTKILCGGGLVIGYTWLAMSITLSPAAALDKVTMGITGTSSDVASFIAVKKGYFRDEGLDVDQSTTRMGVNSIAALAAGEYDAAAGAATAPFYNAVARGVGLKVVASVSSAPPGYGHTILIVRKAHVTSGRYAKPTDIKGMKVAMPAPGASATATLNAWLVKIGLKYADIDPVFMNYSNHVVGLAGGAIDVGLTAEPQASMAMMAGDAVKIASDDVMDPNHEAGVLLFSPKFMQTRPDVAVRFMKAWLRGVRVYNDSLKDGLIAGPNADEVINILVEMTDLKDARIYRAMGPQGTDPDGKLNVEGLRRDLDFYKSQGWIEGPASVEAVMDATFAESASKALGAYVKKK